MWKHAGCFVITITYTLSVSNPCWLKMVPVCMWSLRPGFCVLQENQRGNHITFSVQLKDWRLSEVVCHINCSVAIGGLNKSTLFQVSPAFSNIFNLLCQLIISNMVGNINLAGSRNWDLLGTDIKLIRGRHTEQSEIFLRLNYLKGFSHTFSHYLREKSFLFRFNIKRKYFQECSGSFVKSRIRFISIYRPWHRKIEVEKLLILLLDILRTMGYFFHSTSSAPYI